MIDGCATCGHEKDEHYTGDDDQKHCMACQANNVDCNNFVRVTIED